MDKMTAETRTRDKTPGIMLYRSLAPALLSLSDSQTGQLTKALMNYVFNHIEPQLPAELIPSWYFLKGYADQDAERYHHIAEKRRAAAEKRWTGEGAGNN